MNTYHRGERKIINFGNVHYRSAYNRIALCQFETFRNDRNRKN